MSRLSREMWCCGPGCGVHDTFGGAAHGTQMPSQFFVPESFAAAGAAKKTDPRDPPRAGKNL